MKTNVYQMVTDRIIEQLQKGIIPWHQPWTGASLEDGGAVNYVTRKPYSQINQFLLGRPGEWLSFKQIKDLGGSIKKGEKSSFVVFFTFAKATRETTKEDGTNEKVEIQYPVLRYYNVFHVDQCNGIETKINEVTENEVEPIDSAENVINGYLSREPKLRFQNDTVSGHAYYSPSKDMVVVPKLSQYPIVEEYYSTTFHELVHSTSPAYRCDRKSEQKGIAAFGNEEYSREELVAEIGSAMLCNVTGIEHEKAFRNSVAYIQSWLKALKNDNKMIVWAA